MGVMTEQAETIRTAILTVDDDPGVSRAVARDLRRRYGERHRTVVDNNMQKAPPDMPSAEHGALVLLERSAVVAALRELPARQREAIVLRYYADLSEAEIAAAMGISRGAVKSHTARGMTALRAALERES